MNPQLSFSSEDIKDNFSTPKFPKNKSVNSPEKEENTLDTLKQQIDKVYNDKDTLNNDNINESKNEKNFLLNSLLNNNSNLDLNNLYMSQFSFDEKSSNFLSKKENAENNTKDNDKNKNEMLIKEDNIENKNNIDDNNNNEENNEIKYINKLTNEENEKNEDSNFDYELPLGSDDNPEFFYVCENTEENKKKVKNEKKEGGDEHPHSDVPPLKLKNDEILTPKRQKRNKLNEKIHSAKINFDENKLLKIKENEKKENMTKFNSSNKKIYKILKYSSLIEEDSKSNDYFSDKNNSIINSNTYYNSFKNTNFTSKDNNLKKELNNKINNDKISINPFMLEKIEKIEKNENIEDNREISQKFKINSNIIKDITITYYDKKHKKNRNSINFMGRNNNNNFLDLGNFNKTNIIYEKKNLSIDEPRSFSISKNGTHHHSHSRNYKEIKNNNNNNIKNETMTSTNYFIKNRIKNRVILLTKDKNRKTPQDFFGRNNSLKNLFLSDYENFSKQNLEKKNIEGKTERTSPFRKSKITDSFMTKNPSYKNYILQNINNNNKISHYKNKISQTTFNDYYPKKELIYSNNTTYMNLANKNNIFQNKGNLTQRNKDIGPINIYSKKILFISNGNNNTNKLKQNFLENIPINNNNKIKPLKKREINKSYIIPKEKNIKIFQDEISNITKNKTRTKFNEYIKDVLSNINITKTLVNQKPNLNNKKPKEQNEKHKIRKLIQLSNIDMNTMTTKTIQASNKVNKLNNNKINKDKNKNKIKNTFAQSRKNIIEMFRNNILNYSINRNNKNNQVKNEVSIFIGDNNIKNNKNINLKKNLLFKNKNNDKSKKTIINVNQYYSSYYIKK